MDEARSEKPAPSSWVPHVVISAVLVGALALAETRFTRYQRLMEEDGWAEWGTFLAFAVAGGLALADALRRPRARARVLGSGALALFCLFVAGEEISWGQRLLGFRPPDFFLEANFQQEANLHNVLQVYVDPRWVIAAVALGYGVALPGGLRLLRRAAARGPALALAPWFAAVAALQIWRPYYFTSELAELLLGLALLSDVVARRRRRGAARRWEGLAPVAVLGLAACCPLVVDAALLERARARMPDARIQLRSIQEEMLRPGVLQEALITKSRVHKRLRTAIDQSYLDLPAEKFYLDPWNQPYWLLFGRTNARDAVILVYSYGPNRRRDSDIAALFYLREHPAEALAGDDVGMVIEIRDL